MTADVVGATEPRLALTGLTQAAQPYHAEQDASDEEQYVGQVYAAGHNAHKTDDRRRYSHQAGQDAYRLETLWRHRGWCRDCRLLTVWH